MNMPAVIDHPLAKYDAACRAIDEAKRVDEAKQIRDVAIAMRAYARQAKNFVMEMDAIEIRMRATRRVDQLRVKQKETVGLAKGGQPYQSTGLPRNPVATLAEAGIDKNLATEGRKLGALSEVEFEEAIKTARSAVRGVIKSALRTEDKATARGEKEKALGAKITAMPGNLYGVIYADPPWRFEPYSRDSGMDRAADNHYPTTLVEKIMNMRPPAAPDAVLFIWATQPMLIEALTVLEDWGFDYKSHCIWAKDRIGTGYWFRNKHELLLVGTRGRKVPAPIMGTQWESVIHAPVGEHSAKPAIFRTMIEGFFPSLPKLELFARGQAAPGWDTFGNEVE